LGEIYKGRPPLTWKCRLKGIPDVHRRVGVLDTFSGREAEYAFRPLTRPTSGFDRSSRLYLP
jgi:hypothetical protein